MSAITPIEQDASLFAREMSDAYRDMCYADDGFKQFAVSYGRKILPFASRVSGVFLNLRESAEFEERARKLLQGTIRITVNVPSTNPDIITDTDNPPLGDEDFRIKYMSLKQRTMGLVYQYILNTPIPDLIPMLDASQSVQIVLTPEEGSETKFAVMYSDNPTE